MSPDRYLALITRQEKKLDYIEESLHEVLEQLADELPPSPSVQAIVRRLKEREVPTSGHPKARSNWVAQTLLDFLRIGQQEISEEVLFAPPNKRYDGFLLSSEREFQRMEPTMRLTHGTERVDYERVRLDKHQERIRTLASKLKQLFPRIE